MSWWKSEERKKENLGFGPFHLSPVVNLKSLKT